MAKPHTFSTLYDDLKTVSISFLTKHGYLKPNQWQSGTMTWSMNGNKTGSISIIVNTELVYYFSIPEQSMLKSWDKELKKIITNKI